MISLPVRIPVLTILCGLTAPGWGQTYGPPVPQLEHPEDFGESIDPEVSRQGNAADAAARERAILEAQRRELDLTAHEQRQSYDQDIYIALGATLPWQELSLGWHYLYPSGWAFGFGIGGGRFSRAIQLDKHFEIEGKSRSLAFASRYFFDEFEPLVSQFSAGLASWEGDVQPSGSGEGEDSEKLSASFDGYGLFLGFNLAVYALWDSGWYLEWVPFGIRVSRIISKDQSRESSLVNEAIAKTVEQSSVYGFANIRVGFFL